MTYFIVFSCGVKEDIVDGIVAMRVLRKATIFSHFIERNVVNMKIAARQNLKASDWENFFIISVEPFDLWSWKAFSTTVDDCFGADVVHVGGCPKENSSWRA